MGSVVDDAKRLLDRCPPPGEEPWHGTAGGYSNHACRCDPCRLAHNAKCRDYRRLRRASRGVIPRAPVVEPLTCTCDTPDPQPLGDCGSCYRLIEIGCRFIEAR